MKRSVWMEGLLYAEKMHKDGWVYKGCYRSEVGSNNKIRDWWLKWDKAVGFHRFPTMHSDFVKGVEDYCDQLGRLKMIEDRSEYLYVPE